MGATSDSVGHFGVLRILSRIHAIATLDGSTGRDAGFDIRRISYTLPTFRLVHGVFVKESAFHVIGRIFASRRCRIVQFDVVYAGRWMAHPSGCTRSACSSAVLRPPTSLRTVDWHHLQIVLSFVVIAAVPSFQLHFRLNLSKKIKVIKICWKCLVSVDFN
jgi:hypothetical protein